MSHQVVSCRIDDLHLLFLINSLECRIHTFVRSVFDFAKHKVFAVAHDQIYFSGTDPVILFQYRISAGLKKSGGFLFIIRSGLAFVLFCRTEVSLCRFLQCKP